MDHFNFLDELDANAIASDTKGVIIYMNKTAIQNYIHEGGALLIGQNLLDCHPEPARTKCVELLKDQSSNIYTIEKNGNKKIIIQKPWYKDGVFGGLLELSFRLPEEMKHFVRKDMAT